MFTLKTAHLGFLKRLILLLLCGCGVALAEPRDLVTERAWVEDPTGHMSLEQVRQAPEHPLNAAHFNQGYSASAFWIRLRIDPSRIAPDEADDRLIMRISPPNLDELQLYDPLHQDMQAQISGDRHSQRANDFRSLNFNFVLARDKVPRDVWLRLTTTTSTLTHIQVLTETEARALDWLQTIGALLYIAILVICLGWSITTWLLLRDRLILHYIARELVTILYAMVVLGVLRALTWAWLPPLWLDGISNVVSCWIVVAVIWFDVQILTQYRASPVALWVLRVGMGLSALASVLMMLGSITSAVKIINGVTTVLPVVLFLTTLSARAWSDAPADQRPAFPRWALLGLYLIMPLAILLNRAVLKGWIPPIMVAAHAALVYLLFGSVLMMVLLQIRAFRSYHRQQEMHLRLRLAEQHTQEEHDRREEQERFLAMLGHELRNPLAAVGMLANEHTEEGQQIRRAVSDMTQVLERSVQSTRLADARFVPEISTLDMHVLMRDICQRSDRLDLENFAPDTLLLSDRMCLQIALGNLVDNALKYSASDSRVHVTCRRQPQDGRNTLRVQVSNAPGVAGWPDPQQLFQKYYRSPLAHYQIGSGLGLYLTKSLLQLLGASVVYLQGTDAQPQRVVFEVCIPSSSNNA